MVGMLRQHMPVEQPRVRSPGALVFRGPADAPIDETAEDELDRYLAEPACPLLTPLEYWRKVGDRFPRLSQLARKVYTVPGTTVNVERLFSTAGWMVGRFRTSLQPETLQAIVLIRLENRLRVADVRDELALRFPK